MVYKLAKCLQASRMQYSLNVFSKYNRKSPLIAFMTTLVNEASLHGITDEIMLMRTFCSLMIGKVLTAQAK